MKRKGYIYDRMWDWDLLKDAQSVSCKNKGENRGVQMHKTKWMANLVEIQNMIINHKMRTGKYRHEYKVSGQGKMRDISKLYFHPSHIQHQAIVMAGEEEIERTFIEHTYASRKGYGQHKGASQINVWVQRYHNEYPIYLQLDIRKYYENIPHKLIRKELFRIFKDKDYVNAYIEPVEKFSPSGIGIPLGIRPSQILGNLALSPVDRYIKEELKCRFYIRYLDDMVLLCKNKGEAHRFANGVIAFLNKCGFELHEPKIDHVKNGIDFLGYVTYPERGMFWRTSDKKAWLKRRSRVTNFRRLREIDASAWGYIIHGNKHCKRLYRKMSGIRFDKLGIDPPVSQDKNGKRIIEAQSLSMQMVLDKDITILDLESGVETSHGGDRVVMLIECMGTQGKIIVNAPFKLFFTDLFRKGVTKVRTQFYDKGGKHYEFKHDKTYIEEVNHRQIGEEDGELIYTDNKEKVILK